MPSRRMTMLVVALCLAAAGCASAPAPRAASGPCDPIVRPPLQGGGHLLGDQQPPEPYSSTPPTSGWHSSGEIAVGVHGSDDALSEPEQVSVLELGAVVVSYRDLDADELQQLEAIARDRYPGRVAVTPYGELDSGQLAMTAWGVLQRCDGLDADAVIAFIEDHADEQPAGHGH